MVVAERKMLVEADDDCCDAYTLFERILQIIVLVVLGNNVLVQQVMPKCAIRERLSEDIHVLFQRAHHCAPADAAKVECIL
mmetsp:Transcript_7345/g.12091  ORF Transcript_7345/g.12091 Transcript_7345/m.12091 type:complete len:81 (+) Transcript_7345:168-410(+)